MFCSVRLKLLFQTNKTSISSIWTTWFSGNENASNRYKKLTEEKSVRTELEVWNANTMNTIDIIRHPD